jgi:hypothetical protein
MVAFPILLNVVLAATVLGTVRLIGANANCLGTEVPLAVGLSGGLGLFHWFPIYLALGARFIWHSVGPMQGLWYLALLNMVFPVVSLSGATYDGSLLAIILSPFLVAYEVGRWRRRCSRQGR